MTARRIGCALAGLAVGLVFYLAYRSDYTLSNRLLRWLCGPHPYAALKQPARYWLPVPVVVRGCLPSALWCFIAVSLSGSWKVRVSPDHMLRFAALCPWFNAAWEGVQWLHWTDGHGDWLDVAAGFAGWPIARAAFAGSAQPEEIRRGWDWRMAVVVLAFASMGLADVWR